MPNSSVIIVPDDCPHEQAIVISDLTQSPVGHMRATVCPACGTLTVSIAGIEMRFALVTEAQLEAAGQALRSRKQR